MEEEELDLWMLLCRPLLLVLHATPPTAVEDAAVFVDDAPVAARRWTSSSDGSEDAVIELPTPINADGSQGCAGMRVVLHLDATSSAGARTLVEVPAVSPCGIGTTGALLPWDEDAQAFRIAADGSAGRLWYPAGGSCLATEVGRAVAVDVQLPAGTRVVGGSLPPAGTDGNPNVASFRGPAEVLLEDPAELDRRRDRAVLYGVLLGIATGLLVESVFAGLNACRGREQ